jgi:hypothetical protein
MKKLILTVLIVLLAALPLAAQTASVLRLSGKVEVLDPGGAWIPATVGQQIALGMTISTGFRSQAVLAVGSSQLSVLALTRLTIEELLQTQTGETTTLNLETGKVRAQVRSAAGQTADFKLRSPVSTAAVRGTDFYFDGFRLDVIEGVVEFFNRVGQSQTVAAGNATQTSGGDDAPTYPEDDRSQTAIVSTDTSDTAGGGGERTGGGGAGGLPPPVATTGKLVIVIGN